MLTVDDDEDEAVEFSSSNCCTCRISTYSSSWFCDAADETVGDDEAAAEISAEFGRLPLKSKENVGDEETFSITVRRQVILKVSVDIN